VTVAASAATNRFLWRGINIALCLAGVLVFGGMLAYLQSMPRDFETRAQAFIIDKIDAELATDSPMRKLAKLEGLPSDRIEAIEANLAAATRNFIRLTVEALCVCDDRDAVEEALLKAYDSIELKLKPRFDVLRGIVEAKYHAVFDELRRDITIFLASNLIVLGIALFLALFRGRAARHLVPLSILLTFATLLTTYWYVFGQNWILTIIFSDYLGWSYLAFLAVVFLLLVDIALNHARVLSKILNALADALGADWVWLPC